MPANANSGTKPDQALVLFSDLEKYWREVRDVVEGYATKYLSPSSRPNRFTADEWIEDGGRFAVQLWTLWAKGLTIAAQEGGRVIDIALEEQRQQQPRRRRPMIVWR